MYDDKFNANDYVHNNCTQWGLGLYSDSDVSKIENDSSLTYAQKEAAKQELRHLSDLYY